MWHLLLLKNELHKNGGLKGSAQAKHGQQSTSKQI
jgi:hypothetical protein